jgi:hypothetical protein
MEQTSGYRYSIVHHCAERYNMNGQNLDEILKANPNAPTNDEYALIFARKLLPPVEERVEVSLDFGFSEGARSLLASEAEDFEWCGEYTLGLLEAVVASTLISDEAKKRINSIFDDSAPSLERQKTIGHFRFMWTETSPDARDNVTEADIDATGVALNDCWNRYAADFRQPKANLVGGQRIVDVHTYFHAGLYGSTSSMSNRIFLNSLYTVRDGCRRLTVSAHELFHRVQYAYGYITGTGGQTWWVEGTASWSQDYSYDNINDYGTRVNSGLSSPDTSLPGRSYDACHYWKYFGEQVDKRSTPVTSEEQALQELLSEYSTNGLDAKAASGTVTQSRVSRTFDQFFQDWSKANYIKDLDNPGTRYEYDEDEEVTTSCGRNYGPYKHVAPVVDETIASDTFSWTSSLQAVNAYGTDYLLFRIDPSVTRLSIRFEGNPSGGSGQFSGHLIMIKSNRWQVIYNKSLATEWTRNLSFAAGTYDRAVLVVNGLAVGGQYKVSVNACVSGIWQDNYNYIWTLVQSGSDISGTVRTRSCGTYTVTGTFSGTKITLKASGRCCDFVYEGTVVDCEKASGEWTNDCGGKGLWDMSKTDALDAEAIFESEDLEIADEPATCRP